jgi:hypothetical protein
MKKYYVEVPIAGYAVVEIETDITDKNEIIELAMEKATDEDVQEYEFYEKLVEGNVCHTYHTRAQIVDEEEIE